MTKNKGRLGDWTVLILAFIICALVLGALLLKKYEMREQKPAVSPGAQQGSLLVTLFFASPDGDTLVREGREIDPCEEPARCVEAVICELVNGPMGNLTPTLPPATKVTGVRIEGDKAIVDIGDDLVKGLPGGSSSEMLAVYSIIDTVAVNFPRIRLVKILINGKPVETLKGHLDLREPLAPDFTLEKDEPGKRVKTEG